MSIFLEYRTIFSLPFLESYSLSTFSKLFPLLRGDRRKKRISSGYLKKSWMTKCYMIRIILSFFNKHEISTRGSKCHIFSLDVSADRTSTILLLHTFIFYVIHNRNTKNMWKIMYFYLYLDFFFNTDYFFSTRVHLLVSGFMFWFLILFELVLKRKLFLMLMQLTLSVKAKQSKDKKRGTRFFPLLVTCPEYIFKCCTSLMKTIFITF